MTLEQFGEELKQRRLDKQISLLDISTEIRVNLKFLEALERGQFHILPQTYVRAFLREYSLMVGLAPEVILKQYDDIVKEPRSSGAVHTPEPRSVFNNENGAFNFFSIHKTHISLVGFALVGIIIILWFSFFQQPGKSQQKGVEIPFEKVVQENEAAAISQNTVSVPPPPIVPPKADSLHLEMTTTDSVWISLLIDKTKSEEHLIGPHRTHTWTAKERFAVTMGNAGGATFRLNGKELGALGKRGAVLRNAILTEANLNSP